MQSSDSFEAFNYHQRNLRDLNNYRCAALTFPHLASSSAARVKCPTKISHTITTIVDNRRNDTRTDRISSEKSDHRTTESGVKKIAIEKGKLTRTRTKIIIVYRKKTQRTRSSIAYYSIRASPIAAIEDMKSHPDADWNWSSLTCSSARWLTILNGWIRPLY